MTTAAQIRAARALLGIDQKQLAELAGVSLPTIQRMEASDGNVQAGATGPVSGMLHSAFLLGFMLVAAPLASYAPLAALAGVLAVVAWNMAEKHAFATLLRSSGGDALVLIITFGLVIFRDLTEGIVVGFALRALLFIDRMAKSIAIEGKSHDQPRGLKEYAVP